ncbi:MAG: hypothetical protein E7Z65_08035 [Thermoplasmata archaeon]|jgi:hypothetical protein|nr:hypothetical protein [Thermoplasmata archaeon]
MDTRKITLIATIAVIALVAVGVGYAYTAITNNEGNTTTVEYVTLTQNGTGAYQFVNAEDNEIYFDTVGKSTGIEYSLTDESDYNHIVPGARVIKMGNSFDILTAKVGGTNEDLTCQFTTTGFTVNDGWKIYMIVAGNEDDNYHTFTMSTNNVWDNDSKFTINWNSGASKYDNITVSVYLGYTAASETATVSTAPVNPLTSAKIEFKVTEAELTNHVFEVEFNPATQTYSGEDLTPPAVTVKVKSTTLTVTTNYTIAWTNSAGEPIPAGKFNAAGTYTLTITGAGTYAGMSDTYYYTVAAQQ